jgi:hypothetical protein
VSTAVEALRELIDNTNDRFQAVNDVDSGHTKYCD